MALQLVEDAKKKINEELHKDNKLGQIGAKFEEVTKLQREYLAYGVLSLLSLYLIIGHMAELLCNLSGMAYPAYASIAAIQSESKTDDTQWLTYWVVFALFSIVDFGADMICSWFPFYWLGKCLLFLWLYHPAYNGAQLVYEKYVKPFMDAYGKKLAEDVQKITKEMESKAMAEVVNSLHHKAMPKDEPTLDSAVLTAHPPTQPEPIIDANSTGDHELNNN